MTVSILGCGWYGKALAKKLLLTKISVKGSFTDAIKKEGLSLLGIQPYQVSINKDNELSDDDFFAADVLVISIPPKFRTGQGSEYLYKIKRIINLIERNKIKQVIYISSTGVYGDNNQSVNELDVPKPDDEQGAMLLKAEQAFKADERFKTTIIRFGGLIGPGRDPGRFFAGKADIPNGWAPVNLIHLDDCVDITIAVINQHCTGEIFNAVMPYHPDKKTFYTKASLRSGLTQPLFTGELKQWKIVESVNLADILNYKFKFANEDAEDFTAGCNT